MYGYGGYGYGDESVAYSTGKSAGSFAASVLESVTGMFGTAEPKPGFYAEGGYVYLWHGSAHPFIYIVSGSKTANLPVARGTVAYEAIAQKIREIGKPNVSGAAPTVNPAQAIASAYRAPSTVYAPTAAVPTAPVAGAGLPGWVAPVAVLAAVVVVGTILIRRS